MKLDAADLRILRALQRNARLTNVALAAAVGLSPSPCLARVRALERRGLISRYVALLDPEQVGLSLTVFVSVSLDDHGEARLAAFADAVADAPEVMECYLMTGDADYFLRVVVADVNAFRRFVLDKLTKWPGVRSVRSSVALDRVKSETALPIG